MLGLGFDSRLFDFELAPPVVRCRNRLTHLAEHRFQLVGSRARFLEFFASRTDAFIKRRAFCVEARQRTCRFRLRDGQLLDAAVAFVQLEAVGLIREFSSSVSLSILRISARAACSRSPSAATEARDADRRSDICSARTRISARDN